jgi:hypothetical protein
MMMTIEKDEDEDENKRHDSRSTNNNKQNNNHIIKNEQRDCRIRCSSKNVRKNSTLLLINTPTPLEESPDIRRQLVLVERTSVSFP